jgi:chromosome segregation ATPase
VNDQEYSEHEHRLHERVRAVEVRLDERCRSIDHRITDNQETQREINKKQNELRTALEEQAERTEQAMVPRKEFNFAHKTLETAIEDVRKEFWAEIRRVDSDLGALRQEIADMGGVQKGREITISTLIAGIGASLFAISIIVTVVVAVVTGGFK